MRTKILITLGPADTADTLAKQLDSVKEHAKGFAGVLVTAPEALILSIRHLAVNSKFDVPFSWYACEHPAVAPFFADKLLAAAFPGDQDEAVLVLPSGKLLSRDLTPEDFTTNWGGIDRPVLRYEVFSRAPQEAADAAGKLQLPVARHRVTQGPDEFLASPEGAVLISLRLVGEMRAYLLGIGPAGVKLADFLRDPRDPSFSDYVLVYAKQAGTRSCRFQKLTSDTERITL